MTFSSALFQTGKAHDVCWGTYSAPPQVFAVSSRPAPTHSPAAGRRWRLTAARGEHPLLSGAPSLATAQSGKNVWPSCRDSRRAHQVDAGSSPWGAADVEAPLKWVRRFGLFALLRPAAERAGRAQYMFFFSRNEKANAASEVQPRVSGDATPQDVRSKTGGAHP